MYLPSSTYRIQFNKGFTLAHFQEILPYLISLKTGTIYASPVFRSVPGSQHGYDVIHPLTVSEEIGTISELEDIVDNLKKNSMGWIQDIVPNHMAFHPGNNWLMDVLKNGRESRFASFFDIVWNHPVFKNKLMVPILGDTLKNALQNGAIRLKIHADEVFVSCGDFILPVNPHSLQLVSKGTADLNTICREVNNNISLFEYLLEHQHYVLTPWHAVNNALNYRRFFTINGLICLKMEDHAVFQKYHEFIFKLVDDGWFNGLRLDHVDGLKKTQQYFERLRSRVGEGTYLVAEKILEFHEKPYKNWPLQGTTGYDFMAMLNGLFTGNKVSVLKSFYKKVTGIPDDPGDIIYRKKSDILKNSFRADLDNIFRPFEVINQIGNSAGISPENLKEALGEFVICCPVYKLYSDNLPLNYDDMLAVTGILAEAVRRRPGLKESFRLIGKLFMSDSDPILQELFLRTMQYTGPVMAKGVEDTAMYIWASLISRNEVGDSVHAPVLPVNEFHELMTKRRASIPASMNATSTHDTKRGEDSRARLSVLSDIADEWMRFYAKWSSISRKYLTTPGEKAVPDENERYFLCQVILGALPPDGKHDEAFLLRLEEYIRKALREAKMNTDWNNPDQAYEDNVVKYARSLLNDKALLEIRKPFFEKLCNYGIVNSLSQIILKCMCPGIPDFYQGTELWDLSFVDPDNRRPVDYSLRNRILKSLIQKYRRSKAKFFSDLYKTRYDGSIKLWMTHQLMKVRAGDPKAFVNAAYFPLKTYGMFSENILAFARILRNEWYVVLVPLHLASLRNNIAKLSRTQIRLPINAPAKWENLWDGTIHQSVEGRLQGDIMRFGYPVVLKGKVKTTTRGSGILLHITSLPGKYGTGSLGQEAFDLIDLLVRTGQKYWQILPVNPAGQEDSPYSSPSAFAGNPQLIDPERLFHKHLINKPPVHIETASRADFAKAFRLRTKLFDEAFESFQHSSNVLTKKQYDKFRSENEYWLNDYALFTAIQEESGDEWIKWPPSIRKRDKKALRDYEKRLNRKLELRKFIQFLFHIQFTELKSYAHSFGIRIIGDMPIYIAYNSADVWSHPDLFKLDKKGNMISVAGVPPDFFSRNGQLWNMPIYDWKNMKNQDYDWWKKRIKRYLEYCDILRFDHFRALSSYWEVPAGDKTARYGRWVEGPGLDFLNSLKDEIHELPILAEDLGDIDEDVLKLRDESGMPGMKVLMFAFDETMPHSMYIPHNHTENSFVYTGTHDNNTVRGWYKHLDKTARQRLSNYLGKSMNATSVNWEMIRLAMNSVSRVAIIPAQDILGLDETARMNNPAVKTGNWKWKLTDYSGLAKAMEKLSEMSYYSGRI